MPSCLYQKKNTAIEETWVQQHMLYQIQGIYDSDYRTRALERHFAPTCSRILLTFTITTFETCNLMTFSLQ
eukprot:c18544_g3_i1 orf=154-366(-)